MLPAVFQLLNVAAVLAFVNGTPVRIFEHSFVEANDVGPESYVTWFVVVGVPQLTLSEAPAVDACTVQVDCWGNTDGSGAAEVEELAEAVRDTIEERHHVTSFSELARDPETGRYRITITASMWNARETGS